MCVNAHLYVNVKCVRKMCVKIVLLYVRELKQHLFISDGISDSIKITDTTSGIYNKLIKIVIKKRRLVKLLGKKVKIYEVN
ncbi:hypothetical protein BpHYR1_053867 [Brachionus plicatilis]|uniref:Uncharacterized protein n=1 Tax=Brachionus plicatilis TaxID=10195 RepID=A0A3M7P788_BRAPC|nr:hypothetical protein BpHYR1_053867 [Brachionus plicatilis]